MGIENGYRQDRDMQKLLEITTQLMRPLYRFRANEVLKGIKLLSGNKSFFLQDYMNHHTSVNHYFTGVLVAMGNF